MVAVLAVLARWIGVERFGVVASALALSATISGLIDFGAGSYWVREFSARRMSRAELAGRSAGKLAAGLLVTALLTLVGLLGIHRELMWASAGLLLASVVSQTYQTLLVARQEGIRLSIFALAERGTLGLSFPAFVFFLHMDSTYAFVAAYLLGSLVLALLTWRAARDLRPDFRSDEWRKTWSGTGYYGLSRSVIALQSMDVVLGAAVGGQRVAGIYGAVQRWTTPITLATTSFSSLLNPIASDATDRHDLWRRMRKSLWLPGISVVMALLMAVLAEPLVLFVLGDEFRGSAPILRVLAVAAALSATAQVASTVLQARRREKFVALGLLVAVGVQLALVVPLTVVMGALGLALAAVVGQATLCVMLGGRMWAILRHRS